MLRAVRKHWFSYDFDVSDRTGTRIATVDLANWRENAKLEVQGRRYLARHETWTKEFVLSFEDGQTVAVAKKPSAWNEIFSLEHGGARYELRKDSPWRSSFVLSRKGVGSVGSIGRKSLFGREIIADLPEELPIEVRVFLLWLVTTMRRRADSAAAGAGARGPARGAQVAPPERQPVLDHQLESLDGLIREQFAYEKDVEGSLTADQQGIGAQVRSPRRCG